MYKHAYVRVYIYMYIYTYYVYIDLHTYIYIYTHFTSFYLCMYDVYAYLNPKPSIIRIIHP